MKKLLLLSYLMLGASVFGQTKISELPSLGGGDAATNDVLPIVDVSAGADGTKKITLAELFSSPVPWQGPLISGQYGGTGVANIGKTITLGGNLATSGANPLTLTTTGATNVTLPTSGTLATTGEIAELDAGKVDVEGGNIGEPVTFLRNAKINGVNALSSPSNKTWRILKRWSAKPAFDPGIKGVALGDSTAIDPGPLLMRQFGYGGGGMPVARAGGLGSSITGNYTQQTDFTKCPQGTYYDLYSSGSSGTLQFTQEGALHAIGVSYLASSSGGRFKVQVQHNKTGSWVDLATPWVMGKRQWAAITSGSTVLAMYDYSVARTGLTVAGTGIPANTTVFWNSGAIRVKGQAIGGSGYTNGVYSNVSLTGGSGSGATANITVESGAVSSVTIANPGDLYAEGDTLTCPASSIGGSGSGWSVKVGGVFARLSNAATTTNSLVTLTFNQPNSGSDFGSGELNTNNGTTSKYSTAWIVVDTSTTTGTPRPCNVRIVATSGVVSITDYLYDAGNFGYGAAGSVGLSSGVGLNWSAGGTWLSTHHSTTPQEVWNRSLWYIDPEIITYKTANGWGGAYDPATYWPAYAAKLQAAAPNATLIFFGSHPTFNSPDRNDPAFQAWDDYFRNWCANNDGAIFIDVRANMPAVTREQYKVDSMASSEADTLHLNSGAGEWLNTLMYRELSSVFENVAAGQQSWVGPGARTKKPAPGWFNEIRLVDDRGNNGNWYGGGTRKEFQVTFPDVYDAQIVASSMGGNSFQNFSGFAKSPTNAVNNTNDQLGLISGGMRVAQFSYIRGAYFSLTGTTNDSSKSTAGWRFMGPHAAIPNPTMTLENRTGMTSPILVLGINGDDSTNSTPLNWWNPDGSEVYEGLTNDANEATFLKEEPVADVTITADTSHSGRIVPVVSTAAVLDYGSIAAAAEATLTFTVTGAVMANAPTVSLGWGGALPDGVVVKQAWVSAADTVSVRVFNYTGVTIDPAAVMCRATVSNF